MRTRMRNTRTGTRSKKDEPPFCDSEIPGISNWDLLGEDFERKAAALGLYSSYELSA